MSTFKVAYRFSNTCFTNLRANLLNKRRYGKVISSTNYNTLTAGYYLVFKSLLYIFYYIGCEASSPVRKGCTSF